VQAVAHPVQVELDELPSQLPEQLTEQEPLQSEQPLEEDVPLHVLEQLLLQTAEQSLHPSSLLQEVKTIGPKAMTPNIGNMAFAVLLKNSLRDWSSSSFSLFFITLEVFLLPPNSQIQRY
jgi:hypothetical protein